MSRSLQHVSWSGIAATVNKNAQSTISRRIDVHTIHCSSSPVSRHTSSHFTPLALLPHSQSRHASSSPSPPSKSDPVSPRTTQNTRLNPPPSTLPPILHIPARQPGQAAPMHWIAQGKAYIAFFKAGVKAVWNNGKAARQLRAEKGVRSSSSSAADAALASGVLTRGEWQLARRAAADSWRLPAFALVLLVCGEFTVLLLPVVGGVVPRTCWIPAQVAHHRRKAEARRADSFRRGDSAATVDDLRLGANTAPAELATHQLVHLGRSLGLYSRWWDRLWDQPPRWLLMRRVAAWESYVRADDGAIARYGGVKELDEEELRIAAEERGVDVLNRKPDQLRPVLQKWLDLSKRQSIFSMVLSRPNVWGGPKSSSR